MEYQDFLFVGGCANNLTIAVPENAKHHNVSTSFLGAGQVYSNGSAGPSRCEVTFHRYTKQTMRKAGCREHSIFVYDEMQND